MADWFYHAPSKPIPRSEPVAVPPTSQIPGLSEIPDGMYPPDEPKKMLIKDTDSAYIRMAKQGGRADLLRQHTPKPLAHEAKGYPRVDWFYQDDIAMEEDQREKPPPRNYEFLQPEYMVHQDWTGAQTGGQSAPHSAHHPQRLPYAPNTESVHHGGRGASDKTVAIEEERKPGYGIRLDKHKKPPVHVPPMERGRGGEGDLGGHPMYAHHATEEVRPVMSKLLAYGYQKDWLDTKEDINGHEPAEAALQYQPAPAAVQYQPAPVAENPIRNRSGHYRRSATQQVSANQRSHQSSANSQGRATHKRRKAEEQGRPDFFNLSASGTRSGTYYRKAQEQSQLPSLAARHDLPSYGKLGPITSKPGPHVNPAACGDVARYTNGYSSGYARDVEAVAN